MRRILLLLPIIVCLPVYGQVTVQSLLNEMIDMEKLAEAPDPWFKEAQASSYDRKSHNGGDDWFANYDVGQYVRTENINGRQEYVLADLIGPGAITRFWSANPGNTNRVNFYFEGEQNPRLSIPLNELFNGMHPLFGPEFSYISGTGGNLYFPIPYYKSLKVNIEDSTGKLRLYYEIGYRTYQQGTKVESFNPANQMWWAAQQGISGQLLSRPEGWVQTRGVNWEVQHKNINPGGEAVMATAMDDRAIFILAMRVDSLRESDIWTDPYRPHVALRHLILEIEFDGQTTVRAPLGDFFGSGPGLNPYENLFFTVSESGWMTSRLVMPFAKSMQIKVSNVGSIPYKVQSVVKTAPKTFNERTYHLHAQWRTFKRNSWPPFDVNFLNAKGEGKVIGTVYQVSNPSYIWWGEGDQKIFIDGEDFPSSFGTGTEDDYGYAYGYNGPFTRPYHAQTRVDGPASGGHISLNRWYVLDALPYKQSIRFDQEIWHWMPCDAVWSHVIYWYARQGGPEPAEIDKASLMPMDLGIRANMLELIEGEDLRFENRSGTAGTERLANCSGARHLVWKNGLPGDEIRVHFTVPQAGSYKMMLNLCMAPEYGKYKIRVNEHEVGETVDAWSDELYWTRPFIGTLPLSQGENILTFKLLSPNPKATGENRLGLDYIHLTRIN